MMGNNSSTRNTVNTILVKLPLFVGIIKHYISTFISDNLHMFLCKLQSKLTHKIVPRRHIFENACGLMGLSTYYAVFRSV
jgi:hypothetical protein